MASTSITICLTVTVLAVLFATEPAYAKRGCSAFGHSCYGGHGKRTDPKVQPSEAELAAAEAYEARRISEDVYLNGPEEDRFQDVKPLTENERRFIENIDPAIASAFKGDWIWPRPPGEPVPLPKDSEEEKKK